MTIDLRKAWKLTAEQAADIYEESGARLRGHFVLSSWKHANRYLKREILQEERNRHYYDRLCQALAANIAIMIESGVKIDFLTGPANGGLILAKAVQVYLKELGYDLEAIDNYKRGEKVFGTDYDLKHLYGRRGVMLEDVVTTGDSCTGLIRLFQESGAEMVATHCLLSIQGKTAKDLGVEYFEPLLDELLVTYSVPERDLTACPMCGRGEPINIDEGVGRGAEYVAKYGQPPIRGIAHMT